MNSYTSLTSPYFSTTLLHSYRALDRLLKHTTRYVYIRDERYKRNSYIFNKIHKNASLPKRRKKWINKNKSSSLCEYDPKYTGFCVIQSGVFRALDGFSNSHKASEHSVCMRALVYICAFKIQTNFRSYVLSNAAIHIHSCRVYRQRKIINTSSLMKKKKWENEWFMSPFWLLCSSVFGCD